MAGTNNCVGGIIRVTLDGTELRAKGNYSWNLGRNKRETVMGAGSPHGYKETPQPSTLEGAITDRLDTDIEALLDVTNATLILELPNGKSIVFREAFYSGEGKGSTEEGEFEVKFDSPYPAEVIK